jgi:tetratricopeptide (TPR) repeat protein
MFPNFPHHSPELSPRRLRSAGLACALITFLAIPGFASSPKWIRISSGHFSVLTDGGEKKGREIDVRFEQLRAMFGQLLVRQKVHFSQPLDIIAVRSDEEYASVAPAAQGQLTAQTGFMISGPDRTYVVLDAADDQSWRYTVHDFAHLLLDDNYPPTQGWFDEGFAEYFSSIQLDGKTVQIGGDPELAVAQANVLGIQRDARSAPKSLVDLLSNPVWLSIPDLFTTQHSGSFRQEGTHHTIFYAQSWITVSYLINHNKLAQTGTYFDLVENEHLPIEQAIQQAYGMTPTQLDQAVKDYFKEISPQLEQAQANVKNSSSNADSALREGPAPVQAADVGATITDIPEADAHALIAELQVRLPEHREAGIKAAQSIIADIKTEDSIAHRTLGWVAIEKNDSETASDELKKALQLDPNDAWSRYYLSYMRYRNAKFNGQYFVGMANLMQDMRLVVDWNPDFAEAYNMLAMARLEGGGTNSALEAMRFAIQLSPRNQLYLLNLSRIYTAGNKWDEATALLQRLAKSKNAQIASSAKQSLQDLPTLRKYGILPQDAETQNSAPETASAASTDDNSDADHSEQAPAPPKPDHRPVKFLKGKLVAVDCSSAPAALVTVTEGRRTLKLHTYNYKDVALVGADAFSCAWKNIPVSINYKPGGHMDGDLVSIELP